jgi:hypothetical protein
MLVISLIAALQGSYQATYLLLVSIGQAEDPFESSAQHARRERPRVALLYARGLFLAGQNLAAPDFHVVMTV